MDDTASQNTTQSASKLKLGIMSLTMINIVAIVSVREYPVMASIGLHAILFYLLAAVGFFIPSALICSELASTYPDNGGVYTWVKKAFGYKAGFIAIWMEWINNVVGFPATLATIVATLSFVFFPHLMQEPILFFAVVMVVYLGATLLNCYGLKLSSRVSSIGAILGVMVPSILLIVLGVGYLFVGHHFKAAVSNTHLLPKMNSGMNFGMQLGSIALFVSVLSAYSGMQVTAFHAIDVKNPQKTIPRAILISTISILVLTILASLAIAVVIPPGQVGFMNGVIDAFSRFLTLFHLSFLTPVFGVLIMLAGISALSTWILAPARGLHKVALENNMEGNLPKIFAKTNKHQMPIGILMLQGVIVTVLASLFVFLPHFLLAFWILIAITSQFTMMMYILVFASALKLRFSDKNRIRPYKVPGGVVVMSIVCGLGMVCCGLGFLVGLFPPQKLHILSQEKFIFYMLAVDAVIIGLPLVWLSYQAKRGKRNFRYSS